MSYHRVHTLPSLWRLGCTSALGYVVGTVGYCLSVHIDVVWCGYNGFASCMYIQYVYLPRWMYPSSIHQVSIMYPLCIHQVSIPHIQYNTYIYIPITALHTQCNLNTYALPAYQPDDSPLPPVRSSRHKTEKQNNQNPQQAACRVGGQPPR